MKPTMPTAIALSGGGTKGDFELGAVRALFSRGIRPDILCGTSVGSINAATIAQGAGGLEELEKIWFFLLRKNEDMYLPDPVFASFPQRIQDFFVEQAGKGVADLTVSVTLFLPLSLLADAINWGVQLTAIADAVSKIQSGGLKSLYNLNPIRDKLISYLNPYNVAQSGIKLRLATVSLESGNLRFVNELGRFTDDNTQVDLRDAVLASSSIPFVFPPVHLGSENYVDGGIRAITPIQSALDAGADRIFAVVASRAGTDPKPSFNSANLFQIAQRAAEEIMPDQLQADGTNPPRGWGADVRIIQPEIKVHDSFTIDPGLIRIARDYGYMRAAEIHDYWPTGPSDTRTIFRFLLLSQLSQEITQKRLAIWKMEYFANGHRTLDEIISDPQVIPIPDPDALRAVRQMKLELKSAIEQRQQDFGLAPAITVTPETLDFGKVVVPGSKSLTTVLVLNTSDAGVPPHLDSWPRGFGSWWKEWEGHQWTPLSTTPWDIFVTPLGTVPAATPPEPSIFPGDLLVGPLTIGDPQFSVVPNGLTVKGGQSLALTVTFAPKAAKVVQTTLTINSNDASNPTKTVQLRAEGVVLPPTIAVSPRRLRFGSVRVGESKTNIATLRNEGSSQLVITNVTLNDGGGAFAVGAATPIALDSFKSATIQVVFSPDEAGTFAATVSIQSTDAANGGVDVGVEGSGVGKEPPFQPALLRARFGNDWQNTNARPLGENAAPPEPAPEATAQFSASKTVPGTNTGDHEETTSGSSSSGVDRAASAPVARPTA